MPGDAGLHVYHDKSLCDITACNVMTQARMTLHKMSTTFKQIRLFTNGTGCCLSAVGVGGVLLQVGPAGGRGSSFFSVTDWSNSVADSEATRWP